MVRWRQPTLLWGRPPASEYTGLGDAAHSTRLEVAMPCDNKMVDDHQPEPTGPRNPRMSPGQDHEVVDDDSALAAVENDDGVEVEFGHAVAKGGSQSRSGHYHLG